MYSYDDHAVVVTSENGRALSGINVTAQLYNLDATQKWSQKTTINVTPDTVAVAFQVPAVPELSRTYFLALSAADATGKLLSNNFYWLSTTSDKLDWSATHDTVYTPQIAYADLTGLQDLPRVSIRATVEAPGRLENGLASGLLTLTNPGKAIAFMTHLRLVGRNGQRIVPTLWEDNYISLLPGESRKLTFAYPALSSVSSSSQIVIDGWNVASVSVPLH
jgi:exo-1,4-beta-D-glucosaminidase